MSAVGEEVAPEEPTVAGEEAPPQKAEAEQTPQEEVVEKADDEEEPDDGVPRVLVTGASGYIASRLTKVLLEDGRFRVRGTVRSKKKKEKVLEIKFWLPTPHASSHSSSRSWI